nr:MAG TPA: hypothetical protein [Caudoviricetes sp.]
MGCGDYSLIRAAPHELVTPVWLLRVSSTLFYGVIK